MIACEFVGAMSSHMLELPEHILDTFILYPMELLAFVHPGCRPSPPASAPAQHALRESKRRLPKKYSKEKKTNEPDQTTADPDDESKK